jgi:hypothetical protein
MKVWHGFSSATPHADPLGVKRVCENLKGTRKPAGFAKAYLSG